MTRRALAWTALALLTCAIPAAGRYIVSLYTDEHKVDNLHTYTLRITYQ